MHPGNLGLFLLWLQNVEVCLTLQSTVQLPEMDYLAKSLTPEECYRLYNLLDHRGTIGERTSVYGIRRHAVPCINLLAAWLTSHDRSKYKANENIQLKLRQIGRTDLAHWLGYNTIHQRQLANVKAGARVEESENGRRHVAVQKTTSGTICPSDIANNNVTENYDVKYGFWKIIFLMLLMLLSVLLFVCCYRSSFIKLRSLYQRSEKKRCKKDDEERWLREDRHRTMCCNCSCEGTNEQRGTSASKFKNFSPFNYFTKKNKRYQSNDNQSNRQIHQIKMEKKRLESSDSNPEFATGIPSERNLAQQKMENGKRSQKIDEIKRKLQSVNYDVRCLNLSKTEHNLFISLSNQELRKMSLTSEHIKYYIASDSERKPLLPSSSSQERNLKIDAFQTKLVNSACDPVSKTSEREFLTNLSSLEEKQRLYVSESNRNFNSEEKIQEPKSATEPKTADSLEAMVLQLKDKLDRNSNTELTAGEKIFLSSLTVQQMTDMNISMSQIKLLLPNASERDVSLGKRNLEAIKEKIRSDTSITRPSNSEGMTMGSLSAIQLQTVNLTPMQIEFLMIEPEYKMMIQNTIENKKKFKSSISQSSVKTVASNTIPLTFNKDYRKIWIPVTHNKTNRLFKTPLSINVHSVLCNCKAISRKSSNVNIHSSCPKLYEEDDTDHIPKDEEKTISKIEKSALMLPESPTTPSGYSNCTDFGGSIHDSELSDTYDELGMLFSQHMKQQTRPCQRKYCLLGRLLKRKSYHDKKQCHIRHNYYREYLSDQRPACSSGNVCKDTYDEFNLMYATPNEKKQLSNAIYERRKQFLAQPCVTPGRQVIPLHKNN